MGEMEAYILKKLDGAIIEASTHSNFHFAARVILPNLHKDFKEIRQLILKKQDKIKQAAASRNQSNALTTSGVDGGADEPKTSSPATAKVTGGGATEYESVTATTSDGGSEKEPAEALPAAVKTSGPESDTSPDETGSAKKESEAEICPATATGGLATDHEPSSPGTSAGSAKKESEAEISPATATGGLATDHDPSSPGTSAGSGEKESEVLPAAAKTGPSGDVSEISPVTDVEAGSGAAHHPESTTLDSAGGGKKESDAPHAPISDKTSATDGAPPVKHVDEENLLREQLYYLNNVLTEWQMITEKPFSYSYDSVASVKDLSKTLKKIKQDLKTDPAKKSDESSHSSIARTDVNDNANANTSEEVVEFRWSTRLVNPERVYGFEDKILSLERLLVHHREHTDPFKAFGFHGMAGVGKTTLCQSIFNRNKVMEYFFPRIWVCLSRQKGEDKDNRKEVVKRMLRCLGIDDKIINMVDDKQGIRGLLFALRLQLTGKRYFIVLDDAHNTEDWFNMLDSSTDAANSNDKIYDKFAYGLPKECGGTVLVTSRAEQIVKNMVGDEENLWCIEPLTDEESCWKIFKDTVTEDEILFPDDLTKLRSEIVKRCYGLPLAAKLLGQIKHKELCDNVGNQQGAIQQPK